MLVASFCLFVGVQFMFEYRSVSIFSFRIHLLTIEHDREEEARRGIVRNC